MEMDVLKGIGSLDGQLRSHQLWFNQLYVQNLEPLLQEDRRYEQPDLAEIDWFKDFGITVSYLVANRQKNVFPLWTGLD